MKVLLSVILVISAFSIELSSTQCVEEPVSNVNVPIGGYRDIAINDGVRNVALRATALWNAEENEDENYFKVTCIRKAQSHVVAGVEYKIKVTLGETQCGVADLPESRLLTQANVDACALKSDGQTLSCEMTFWEKSWENFTSLTGSSCQIETFNQYDSNNADEDDDDDNEGL